MRKIIQEIICQNNIFDENKEFKYKRKKIFLSLFSYQAILIFGFFTIFHFFLVTNIVLASCLLVTFLIFLFNLLYYYKSKNIDFSSTVIIIVSIILLSISVINGGYKNSGLYWIFVIPVVSFYYKGKKAGSVFCIVFFVILLSILLLSEFDIVKTVYSTGHFSVVLVVYLFLSLMIYFYEDTSNVSENIIRKQIYTDSLTRLPNRIKLIEDLTCSDKLELILINVDDFKQINDIYGANVGDQLLIELSNRLKSALKGLNCKIYKLHADEFAVLFLYTIRKSELLNYSKGIHIELTRDIIIDKLDIIVSVSIGIAKGAIDALSNADIALKTAKENKKVMILFNKSMNTKEKYANNIKWLKIIKNALLFDNLVPYFQPIVNNFTGKVDKYECLIRLLDRDKVISPFFFLDIAKRSKIYPYITEVVILKSFEAFKNSNCHFSVNITVDDILNKSTRDFIYNTMKEYNNSKNVVFEIVESEEIQDIDEVYDFIKTVKAWGSKIAIDDFGSGYSNYEYILRLNIDYIKIDSSLIKNIATDKNSQILIETIVDFTKKLNIETIAEFVHSKEVYEKVKKLKIDYSQGYYLGKPGPRILY